MANIEKRLDVLQDLKHKVQELMISESEESKATDEFTTKIEEDMATFDGVVNELEKSVKRLNDGEQAKPWSKVDQEHEENFRRRYEEEMRLKEMRMEMRKKYVDSEGKKSASESNKYNWGFTQSVEALRKSTERNPKIFFSPDKNLKLDKMYYTRENEHKSRVCIYCDKEGRKSSECKTVAKVSERRLILSQKRLCFNCTGSKHRASECRSTKTCLTCKEKHHTSICEKSSNMLLTTNTSLVTYPVLVIEVEGVKCRALIDTGAGSPYASSKLLNKINKKPIRREIKRIETLMHSVVKKTDLSVRNWRYKPGV